MECAFAGVRIAFDTGGGDQHVSGGQGPEVPDHLRNPKSLTPGNVLVASACIECNPDSSERAFHGALTTETEILTSPAPLLHPENPIPDSAVMVHRDAALAAGGFRDVFCEDLDMWCRVLGSGRAALSPKVGMLYHAHAGQMSADWEGVHEAHLRIARSHSTERWWSPRLVERRLGVTAWYPLPCPAAQWHPRCPARLPARPGRASTADHRCVDVLRHRVAVRRRASRLALSGYHRRSRSWPAAIRRRSGTRIATRLT